MQVAFRSAVPVGLVRWRSNATCYSPFVKLTYDLGATGWASPSSEIAPISEGDVESGRVLRPSDFAEAKGACEVALVGRILAEHVGAVRLRIGGLNRETPRIGALGPASVGGGREYFSSEENRLPFPSLPLEIAVEGIGSTLRSVIPAPTPHLALVFSGGWASLSRVPLFIDSVLIDARRQRCSVVFRGFFTHPGDVDRGVTLVIDPLGRLDETTPAELAEWPRGHAVEAGEEAEELDEIDEGDEDEEELTPPRGQPTPNTVKSVRSVEPTLKMRAMKPSTGLGDEATPDARPKANGPRAQSPLLTKNPSATLPIGVTSPMAAVAPVRRSPAHSGRPVPPPLPSRPPLPSKYDSTQAIPASPSHRQTLPFVASGEGTARHELPLRPPPPPQPSSRERDPSETTQLISVSDLEAKRAALPFEANAEAKRPSKTEPPKEEKRERPKRVPFERPPADPEQTELVQEPATPPVVPAAEVDEEPTTIPPVAPTTMPPVASTTMPPVAPTTMPPVAPTTMPPVAPTTMPPVAPTTMPPVAASTVPPVAASTVPPVSPRETEKPPPIVKPRGSFDHDEGTAQIQLPVQGPVLPFQDEGTSSGLAAIGGKGMVLGLASLGRKDEPTLKPPAFPPMPVHAEPIEGIIQDVASEEAREEAASDTMPPPQQTMPPPADLVSDAPAWFSPTGIALPPPPALATLLSEMGASVPLPPMAAKTQEPVWRPKPVAKVAPEAVIADKLPTLTLDEYAALRAELWSAKRPRRDVLKAHGLSELRWRTIERKWAKEIDSVSGDPDKLMPILSRLQSFAEASRSLRPRE